MVELISLHVPKCAGSTLKSALLKVYGADRVFLDYTDRPADPASAMNIDPDGFLVRARTNGHCFLNGKTVVHGHFWARKYEVFAGCRRITFLRHPIDRTISHYYFWKKLARHGHVLHNYMLDNDLDLIQFAMLPMIRLFYTKTFFGGVDLGTFDFIGRFETIERDVDTLSNLLGREIRLGEENRNPNATYREARSRLAGSDDTLKRLSEILMDDIAFYERLFPNGEATPRQGSGPNRVLSLFRKETVTS